MENSRELAEARVSARQYPPSPSDFDSPAAISELWRNHDGGSRPISAANTARTASATPIATVARIIFFVSLIGISSPIRTEDGRRRNSTVLDALLARKPVCVDKDTPCAPITIDLPQNFPGVFQQQPRARAGWLPMVAIGGSHGSPTSPPSLHPAMSCLSNLLQCMSLATYLFNLRSHRS
jgi:hypothetical protein